MALTPKYKIPYPDLFVPPDVPYDLQALAEKVESLLFGGLPILAGVATLTFNNTNTATATVNFPAGKFTNPPAVLVTSRNSNYYGFSGTPSAASVSVGASRQSGATYTGTQTVQWFAFEV